MMMKRYSPEGKGTQNRGQGLVEFALVLPILLLVSFGIIEFGRLLFVYSAVTTAASEAVRYGTAVDDSSGLPRYADCPGIEAAARRIGSLTNLTNVAISYDDGPGGSTVASSCNLLNPDDIVGGRDRIVVQVEADYESIVPFINISRTFSAESVRTIVKDIELGEGGSPGGGGSGSTLPVIAFTSANTTTTEKRGTITLTMLMDSTISVEVTVPFNLSGSATCGTDYTISATTLAGDCTGYTVTIPAGGTSRDINVTFIDDGVIEGDETISIGIGTPTNATKGSPDVHNIILGDPAIVSFSQPSQDHSENGILTVEVTLDKTIDQNISVPFSVAGTATGSGGDYSLTSSNPFTITAGNLTANIEFSIVADTFHEDDETVEITLGAPTNADRHASDYVHTATIIDNDPIPNVYFAPASQSAAEDIGSIITTLELSAASGLDVSVDFASSGTATENVDYSIAAYSVTIPAGTSSVDIPITIINDGATGEADEVVILNITSVTNAVNTGNYDLTLTETGVQPVVYFDRISTWVVRVQLSNAWGLDVTVPFDIAGDAELGVDYTITSSPVIIPSGSSFVDITVVPIDDPYDEDDEDVIITMQTPTNATQKYTPDIQTITIPDNDDPPTVTFSPILQEDDEDNLGTVTIQAQLDVASGKEITIPFNVGGTATKGASDDFTISPDPYELTILPGDTTADIIITVNADTTVEGDETIDISMGAVTNVTPADSPDDEYHLTIRNDDVLPCDVAAGVLTFNVASERVTWNVINNSQAVRLYEISLNWPEEKNNSPRLKSISFGGSSIASMNTAPTSTTVSDSGWPSLAAGANSDLLFQFGAALGSGNYTITAKFINDSTSDTCQANITETLP
jgi:hypothetical protein